MKQKLCMDENEYVDLATEGVSAKWSSLIAPLMPSLLLSRHACSCLFDTPWRTKTSSVALLRQAAVFLHTAFENDLECQENWLSYCNFSLRSCFQMSAGEVLAWTYTFVFLLMTASGAASVSSFLGLGSLVHRLYLAGCAEAFVSFVYETTCLLQEGPVARAKALARKKAKVFVLSILASTVLPKDILAAHMTSCVLFGFMEKTLKSLFRLAIPSLHVLRCIKDMGNSYATSIVDVVFRTVMRQPAKALAAPLPVLALPAPPPEEAAEPRAEVPEDIAAAFEDDKRVDTEPLKEAILEDEDCDELRDAVPALISVATGKFAESKLPESLENLSETLPLQESAVVTRSKTRSNSPAPVSEKITWHQRDRPRGHRRTRLSSPDFGGKEA